MYVVDGSTVLDTLPMRDCINLMSDCMTALQDQDKVILPPRTVLTLDNGENLFVAMPGAMLAPPVIGAKLVTVFPRNSNSNEPVVKGAIVLFERQTGSPIAIVDAASITALRTAAASGLATRLLADSNSKKLAMLGYGVQADSHIEAMLVERPIVEIAVWGPSPTKAKSFAKAQREKHHVNVFAVAEARDAIKNADIICTVTSSNTPVVKKPWIRSGAHLNLVGAFSPLTREVDSETIQSARLFVELREVALQEAGDIIIPMNEGLINEEHIVGEIGDIIQGKVEARKNASDITAYKSLGNTAQDLVAAFEVYERLQRAGNYAESHL